MRAAIPTPKKEAMVSDVENKRCVVKRRGPVGGEREMKGRFSVEEVHPKKSGETQEAGTL